LLNQLYIENFALIDKLELDIEEGFTVFTGETGSGKSIMIDAISFAIGKRADKSFVRKGCKKSIIELTFFIKDNTKKLLEKILKEEDIDIEDNMLILKREIYADGKSLCKINSRNINISFLKKIASYLINIHGQNEFNELEESNHINILDSFIGIRKTKPYISYQKTYSEYIKLKKEYQELYENYDKEKNEKELDLLNFQIQEIEVLNLRKDEDKQIEDKIQVIENSQQISKSIDGLYEDLYGKSDNILKILKKYVDEFEEFAALDESLQNISQSLTEQYYMLEELAYLVRDNTSKYDYDEQSKALLEDRYDEINKIYSKYGDGYEKVIEFLNKAKKEVNFYEQYEEKVSSIKEKLKKFESQLLKESSEVSKIRQKEKNKLEKQIISELETLGMKNVTFKINISSLEKFTSKGIDDVLFQISFNKGEDVKSFNKVASGGEISRFMLALKNTISSEYEKTMVFDEIDTGISGLASEAVGKKMKDISKTRQVLCITHQGQIASYAQNHINVYKEEDDVSTLTKAIALTQNQRVHEIAKMMDASTKSIKALEHAKELLSKNSL
jgi:DNA repair protein RecN